MLQPNAVSVPVAPQGGDMALGAMAVTIAGGYGAGAIFSVMLNGVGLEEIRDFRTTDGQHIILTSPVSAFEAISETCTARLLVRIEQSYGTSMDVIDGGIF